MSVFLEVCNLPEWLDCSRYLGDGFRVEAMEAGWLRASARLGRAEAADVQARLRGVGLGGRSLEVRVTPPLARKYVRAARSEDSRRRRSASPGFTRPGVRLDSEGRISLTPESIAVELGERVAGARVLDVCCGAGGNAIGFARAGCEVLALDCDAERLRLARHNAKIYGVSRNIEFIRADAIHGLAERGLAERSLAEPGASLLFVDPPWGLDWNRKRTTLEDFPLLQSVLAQAGHFPRIWIKLPPSFEVAALPQARAEAIFGTSSGDFQRVKFLLLDITR